MSNKNYSGLNVDDFVIPDEQEAEMPSNSNSFPNNNPKGGNGMFSSFPWAPKVDLSSTFTPFTRSKVFTDNNKVKERQYTGGDTLDEPVSETLKRDLLQILRRLGIVIWPMQLNKLALKQQQKLIDFASSNGIQIGDSILGRRRVSFSEMEEEVTGISNNDMIKEDSLEWDLWGPLIFSLVFSVTLGLSAPAGQVNPVFSGSFSFIWMFFIIIGLNIQLLGGTISFMSAISAVGYSMFPIIIGGLLSSILIKWKFIRFILLLILNIWSIFAGTMCLKCSGVLPGRILLAIYPIGLMYSVLSWLVVIT